MRCGSHEASREALSVIALVIVRDDFPELVPDHEFQSSEADRVEITIESRRKKEHGGTFGCCAVLVCDLDGTKDSPRRAQRRQLPNQSSRPPGVRSSPEFCGYFGARRSVIQDVVASFKRRFQHPHYSTERGAGFDKPIGSL